MSAINPEGIDLSRHRKVKSFQQLADSGIDFVYTKASEGYGHTDETFDTNWRGLERVGVLRGAFHYYLPALDPVRQAEHFYRVVSGSGTAGMLPPGVDFEEDGARSDHFKLFLDEVEARFEAAPLIYTSIRFWFASAPVWTSRYSLWAASWYRSTPTLPRGWPTWQFHQYTNRGEAPKYGIDHVTVDVNRFNGTREQLQALGSERQSEGGASAEPGAETSANAPLLCRVRSSALRLRSSPWGAELGKVTTRAVFDVLSVTYDGVGRPWFWINPKACLAGWLCDVLN